MVFQVEVTVASESMMSTGTGCGSSPGHHMTLPSSSLDLQGTVAVPLEPYKYIVISHNCSSQGHFSATNPVLDSEMGQFYAGFRPVLEVFGGKRGQP